jgi:hypothetical protein
VTIFTPSLDDTRKQLHDQANRLIADRLRPCLWVMLWAVVMFALEERRLNPSEIVPLYIIKLVQLGTIIVLLRLLQAPRFIKRAIPIAVCTVCLLDVTAAASNIIRHDVTLTPLLLVIVTMGAATVFPWGLAPQLITVVVAALAVVTNIYVATGGIAAIVG